MVGGHNFIQFLLFALQFFIRFLLQGRQLRIQVILLGGQLVEVVEFLSVLGLQSLQSGGDLATAWRLLLLQFLTNG